MSDLALAPTTPGWEFVRAVRALEAEGGYARSAQIETRALLTSAAGWEQVAPVAPAVGIRRRVMVGDLIPRIPVSIMGRQPYVREITASDEDGEATSEGSAKAEVAFEFEIDEGELRKVTAWVPATTELVDDATGMAAYIDGRLRYKTRVREEYQLLDGDGTAPNMLGIRNVDGVQTQAFATSVNETIARSIELVQLADGDASAIVIHPSSYRVGYLASPEFWQGLTQTIVPSRAVGANAAVVGDFATAATIREAASLVRFGDQHDDFLIKNKTAILAELREVPQWHVPSHFVKAALA
jgi:hypothetical protein